jgi:hypothetical protein
MVINLKENNIISPKNVNGDLLTCEKVQAKLVLSLFLQWLIGFIDAEGRKTGEKKKLRFFFNSVFLSPKFSNSKKNIKKWKYSY